MRLRNQRFMIPSSVILLLMASMGISVAQQPLSPLGGQASIEPVTFGTTIKWAIDVLVPIARHEIAIHRYGDSFPSQSDGSLEHVRWFAVWSPKENKYSAVPVRVPASMQSAEAATVIDWLRAREYVEHDWSGEAWVGTNIPIGDVGTSSPVFRADLREFMQP